MVFSLQALIAPIIVLSAIGDSSPFSLIDSWYNGVSSGFEIRWVWVEIPTVYLTSPGTLCKSVISHLIFVCVSFLNL